MGELDAVVATYLDTLERVAALGDQLGADDWDRPTDLPGWSVKDNVAHVAGLEAHLAGHPAPAHELPADLAHVKNDIGRFMETHVDFRRATPGPAIVAELRALIAERAGQLHDLVARGVTEMPGLLGNVAPATSVLQIRVFDVWAHEQDVRRAVGRPGALDGPAAAIARDRLQSGLARVVATAAGPGRSVAFDVRGPTALAATVAVGDDGRGVLRDGADSAADARLSMDFETFVRLGAGRVAGDAAGVVIGGDEALGRAVLAKLAMTP